MARDKLNTFSDELYKGVFRRQYLSKSVSIWTKVWTKFRGCCWNWAYLPVTMFPKLQLFYCIPTVALKRIPVYLTLVLICSFLSCTAPKEIENPLSQFLICPATANSSRFQTLYMLMGVWPVIYSLRVAGCVDHTLHISKFSTNKQTGLN